MLLSMRAPSWAIPLCGLAILRYRPIPEKIVFMSSGVFVTNSST
jgi:hypothetical protein